MTQLGGETFLGEEIEFVHNDESFIYSFRSRDSRITLKRVNSPGRPQEAEVDVFPDASIAVVNTAILVLYKAAKYTYTDGMSMQDFLPTTLRKLATSYSSKEMLEHNIRSAENAFLGGKVDNAMVEDVIKFLEPYTPWATYSSYENFLKRPTEKHCPIPSLNGQRQSIQDVLDLPTKSNQLSGLKETFGLPSSKAAKATPNAGDASLTPRRLVSVKVPKESLSQIVKNSNSRTADKQRISKNMSAQGSSIQPTPPSKYQPIAPKGNPVGFGQPLGPSTPTRQLNPIDKQQKTPTLRANKNTTPSVSPSKKLPRLLPTPASTPSSSVPGADSSTASNSKRQHCQDPFAFNSSEEDEGVVLVNLSRKRRQIIHVEESGESDDRSPNISTSTTGTPPSQPLDAEVSTAIPPAAATETAKSQEKRDAAPREIIDLDLLELEDMELQLVVEEAERTFERQRVRHRESNAARQTLRLKKYKASARALKIQVKILEDEVREKRNLERQLKNVMADLRRIEHEKSEQEKEIATVTAEVAAMAKEKEEVCKEKEELRSENEVLVARVTELETQNKLVVDELQKANEKVQELTQIKDHLLSEHCTLNAENTNLKDELKQKDEANDYLYGALKKAEEDIVRVERSLALVVEGRDRVNRDLQASRDETREANIRAAKDHERAVEAIKKIEEHETILGELAAHEAKTSAERSRILQRLRRDHEGR